jgi:hypothetical protein
MTPAEAAALVVDLVRQLSAARTDVAVWRLIATKVIDASHDQYREITRLQRVLAALRDEIRSNTRGRPTPSGRSEAA